MLCYSAESTMTGAKIGITEYYPADLVARAPSGDVLLQSLELQNLFQSRAGSLHGRGEGARVLEPSQPSSF